MMIYELRTYWAAPGCAGALHRRFRELTLRCLARHGIEVVGFWVPPRADDGDLVYLVAGADQAALEAAWLAFRADPEWRAGKAASESAGPLVTRITSVWLTPTDYSPLQ
jgi:hypothetical protein